LSEGASRVEQLDHGALTWVMLERPTPADVADLTERFSLHPLDAEDLRARESRPKLVARPSYVAAVLDFPVQLARPRRTSLAQLRLIVGGDFVVVVHGGDLRPPVHLMQDLRADAERRDQTLASPGRLAYAIVRELVEASEPSLARLRSGIETLNEEVFEAAPGDPVRQLAQLRREVTGLNRALRPDVEVLFAMARASYTAAGEMDAYWELVADRVQRLVDGLDESWSGLDLLAESQTALQRQRTEERLRALLLFGSVGLPVTALGAIYAITPAGAIGDWELELGVGAAIITTAALVGWLRRRRLI
jgi:magnesium transporter